MKKEENFGEKKHLHEQKLNKLPPLSNTILKITKEYS